MFRRITLALAATLAVALVAAEAVARNPNYYATPRKASARVYSGQYQAFRPNVVPTFTLPAYGGGGFRTYNRGWGYRSYYQQPVVIYPPAVYYGF